MTDDKVLRYLGLARRAGKAVSGVNTCTFSMNRGKASLIILAEDISEGSEKKIMKESRKSGTEFVKYGTIEDLSHAMGQSDRSVFAITDDQFAKTIRNEINAGK